MLSKHKYIAYKEIDVPNGMWLVSKHLMNPQEMRPLTDRCLILYCSHCGNIKGRNISKIFKVKKHDKKR